MADWDGMGPTSPDELARGLRDAGYLAGDATALVAFLTAEGPDRSAYCQRDASEGKHRYYCRISYGSLAATMLGLERWRYGEWVVGITLVGNSEVIERTSAGVPLLGK